MSNRKLSNFLFVPKFQLKLTFTYIAMGVGIIVATGGTVFYKMSAVRGIMNNSVATDFSAQSDITALMFQVAQISMLGFMAFSIISFIFALMISHRIAGPMLAINAFIDEMKKGNYDYGRKLRPNDELMPIMNNLHQLNATLKGQ